MKQIDKKFLLAICIGDGSIYFNEHRKKGCFTLGYGKSQKEYLLWKTERLNSILDKNIKVYETTSKYKGKIYSASRISVTHKYFRFIRNWIYFNNKKYISERILKRMSDEGIAIWYMDDGSLTAKKRNGKIHAYDLVFSTYCNTEEEVNGIIEFFKERFGLHFTIKRNKGKFSVRCGTRDAKVLLNKLDEYIPDFMAYKTFRNC